MTLKKRAALILPLWLLLAGFLAGMAALGLLAAFNQSASAQSVPVASVSCDPTTIPAGSDHSVCTVRLSPAPMQTTYVPLSIVYYVDGKPDRRPALNLRFDYGVTTQEHRQYAFRDFQGKVIPGQSMLVEIVDGNGYVVSGSQGSATIKVGGATPTSSEPTPTPPPIPPTLNPATALPRVTVTSLGEVEASGQYDQHGNPIYREVRERSVNVVEGGMAGFRIEIKRALTPPAPLDVNLWVRETGDFVDYDYPRGPFIMYTGGPIVATIPRGETSVIYVVPTVDDDKVEERGEIRVQVMEGAGYTGAGYSTVALVDDGGETPDTVTPTPAPTPVPLPSISLTRVGSQAVYEGYPMYFQVIANPAPTEDLEVEVYADYVYDVKPNGERADYDGPKVLEGVDVIHTATITAGTTRDAFRIPTSVDACNNDSTQVKVEVLPAYKDRNEGKAHLPPSWQPLYEVGSPASETVTVLDNGDGNCIKAYEYDTDGDGVLDCADEPDDPDTDEYDPKLCLDTGGDDGVGKDDGNITCADDNRRLHTDVNCLITMFGSLAQDQSGIITYYIFVARSPDGKVEAPAGDTSVTVGFSGCTQCIGGANTPEGVLTMLTSNNDFVLTISSKKSNHNEDHFDHEVSTTHDVNGIVMADISPDGSWVSFRVATLGDMDNRNGDETLTATIDATDNNPHDSIGAIVGDYEILNQSVTTGVWQP